MKHSYIKIGWLILLFSLCSVFLISCNHTAKITTEQYTNPFYEETSTENGDKPFEETTYASPYDFEKLQKDYPDIIGWIQIPDTDISYAVFYNPDDNRYLRHDADGNYSIAGEIFIESAYNKSDFSDAVTVIYGHRMDDGTRFGKLQALFADKNTTAKNPEIIIYTPTSEHRYRVFGATTFDNRHILYNYDLNSDRIRANFFDFISKTRSIDTYFDTDIYNQCNGNFIILSTCKYLNKDMRFLVLAGECIAK